MTDQVIQSCTDLLEYLFQYELGSNYFYILLATSAAILCGITWLLARSFGGNARLTVACLAALLPVALGVAAYGMVDVYAVPHLDFDWVPTYLPWAGFGLLLLFTLMLPSKKMLGIGAVSTIIIFVMASAAAGIAYYGADVLIDLADKGSDSAKQQNSRSLDQIVD